MEFVVDWSNLNCFEVITAVRASQLECHQPFITTAAEMGQSPKLQTKLAKQPPSMEFGIDLGQFGLGTLFNHALLHFTHITIAMAMAEQPN